MEINFNGSLAPITATNDAGVKTYMPEPVSKIGKLFQTVLNAGVEVGKGFLSNLGGFGAGTNAASMVGIQPEYADLIRQQLQVQEQMQKVSLITNIEKSRHETDMAVVRNIRVG